MTLFLNTPSSIAKMCIIQNDTNEELPESYFEPKRIQHIKHIDQHSKE